MIVVNTSIIKDNLFYEGNMYLVSQFCQLGSSASNNFHAWDFKTISINTVFKAIVANIALVAFTAIIANTAIK